jgi:putative sterol carrier protein
MTATLLDEPEDWAAAFRDELNDSDEFASAGADLAATFRFEVLPDDSYPGDPVAFTLVVDGGACDAARVGDRETDYDFALRGPYDAWRDLLEERIDVSAAVMGGPFELEGSTIKLMQHREGIAALVAAAQAIDTDYAY